MNSGLAFQDGQIAKESFYQVMKPVMSQKMTLTFRLFLLYLNALINSCRKIIKYKNTMVTIVLLLASHSAVYSFIVLLHAFSHHHWLLSTSSKQTVAFINSFQHICSFGCISFHFLFIEVQYCVLVSSMLLNPGIQT